MPTHTFFRLACLAAAATSLLLSHGLAQAQSSYALTVLKSPSASALNDGMPWAIDAQDQVTGRAPYFSTITYDFAERRFKNVYANYVVRWPAGTGASVSPAKLYATTDFMAAASRSVGKIALGQSQKVFDTATRKVTGTLPGGARSIVAINDAQVVVWSAADTTGASQSGFISGTWSASRGLQTLPLGAYAALDASGINTAGTVAGTVYESQELPHAALWTNGQLQVLDMGPDMAAHAVSINDSGQVLVNRWRAADAIDCSSGLCVYPKSTLGLWRNGVFTRLLPEGDERVMISARLSNAGTVAGRLQAPGTEGYVVKEGRAFIWRNGVLNDLTTLVTSKGAKLPAGAILADVLALNDKGSVVAVMQDSSQARTVVRLTAKP